MFKKWMSTLLVGAFLIPSVPAFADRWHGERGERWHEGYHPYVVHRLGPGYVSVIFRGIALLYSEGMFYRYTPTGYVVVTPPMGAVVPALPPGYTMVYTNGVPYYNYGYTYYTPVPAGGYAVAAPPPGAVAMPVAPLTASAPAAAVAPAPAQPQAAPVNTAPAADTNSNFEIYIANGNGSYTSVTLRKTEKGFLGPQGEFYADHPTVEQLKERYTKK